MALQCGVLPFRFGLHSCQNSGKIKLYYDCLGYRIMKEFTVLTPLSADAYSSAAWLHFFAKSKYVTATFGLGAFVSIALLVLYQTGVYTDIFVLLCAMAVLVSLVMSIMLFWLRLNRMIRANKELFTRKLKLRFTPDGFHAMGKEMDAFFEKEQVCRIIDTKKYTHIYLDKGRAQVSVVKAELPLQTGYDLKNWVESVKEK